MPAIPPDSDETRQQAITPQLPSPTDYPGADILIFDGRCQFCIAQVTRLRRLDRKNRLAFLSLHAPDAVLLCPDLTHEQMMEQMLLVTQSGRRFGGAAVIRYLSLKLPGLWLLAPLLHLPFSLPLWQWVYTKVAARRYRLPGNVDTCESEACEIHFKKPPHG